MTAAVGPTGVQVLLSRDQERTWFVDQLSSHPSDYLIPLRLHLAGPLDRRALRRALTALATRHEALRTAVVPHGETPAGLVLPPESVTLRETDAADPAERDRLLAAEATAPLDLASGPPLRALLVRHGPEEHTLALTVHHVAADDWSCALLYEELAADYAAFTSGAASPVPPLAEPYRTVAARLDERAAAEADDGGLDHWREILADHIPFELPGDQPRPTVRAGRGAGRTAFVLEPAVADRLTALGRSLGATPAMLLTTAVQTVLHRYTGRDDITTGTTYARRDDPATERLVGVLINMLPLRGRPHPDLTFEDYARQIRGVALDAYDHAEVPFDRLVEEIAPERDPSRTPLFQILVNFRSGRRRAPRLPGLKVTELPIPFEGAKYDLCVSFEHVSDGLWCGVNWDTDLYDATTVDRVTGWLERLLRHVAVESGTRLDDIPLLSDAEHDGLRALSLRSPVDTPAAGLHDLVARRAAAAPDAVALVADDGTTTTYAQLDTAANAVAHGLADHGVGPDTPVGLLLDRSVEMVVGLLGILKAGGAYLPIETATPAARVATLLTDAGASVCLTAPEQVGTVTGAGAVALTVDPDASASPLPVTTHPDDLCAVYYTSGSTGRPKGVACTHRGWVNRMTWMQRRHGLRPGETVLHKTTLPFDDAAVEILWPLIEGGTVALLPPGLHRDPRALVDAAVRHRAVHVQFVPSVLELFLDELTAEDIGALRRRLRSVLSSGEALRPALVRRFRDAFGDAISLDNTWGATEVSIDSTFHVCEAADTEGTGAVRLGRPMDNNEVLVLDHRLRPLPPGVPGELCIAGIGLARGYLGDPAKTAGVFVPHPYRPGERVYRTGDRGRMNSDGTFAYLERMDRQVKVRGVRVELGEVEAALRDYPAVTDAAVIARRALSGDLRLAAYIAVDSGTTAAQVRENLMARLPGYAVPSTITVLPELPRSASGKLSPAALPDPDPADQPQTDHLAPRDETEGIIAEIWSEVLGVPRLGVLDDFFGLGGHSLLATRAVNRMRQAFATHLPLSVIFECPTIAAAAERIHDLVLAEIEAMSDDEVQSLLADPADSPVPADSERGTTR
ncbi:non-ribosomal peptide synthetase [Streptomyces sp. NBC_01637]|uniref:non-ribosomal peptide synthetase n=1 Tax=unclassified Streptomyces TaxID=2593676 RepID=UPI0038674334|nr:amino acid adenylation domain-containing protein [Streptomyces sp. NBC_01653]WTC84569.1 amino acid adenylation domain-containing protein [Streptomyces sp. NBC_01653]WTD86298.1 amino acid adenylation domain-containing protein [Streptomyces sp. NBC_01637]WTD94226.1 amino acid adenylation domain-containing protein [Streptomyces sp. NBC_01637]